MDLENKCDKYLGPISFKILYISTAMILMDEIRNESNSLLDNKVLLSEIDSFKTKRRARSCILLHFGYTGLTCE